MFVGYTEKQFNLSVPRELFDFIFCLYGLIHSMRALCDPFSSNFSQIRTSLQELSQHMPPYPKQQSGPGGSKGRDVGSSRQGSSQRGRGTPRSFPALSSASLAMIKANGYNLYIELGWRSLPKNIAHAEKDGEEVALKLVSSKERDILRDLQGPDSYNNHVVTLIDIIDTPNDIIIVMPWLLPLGNCFSGPNANPSVKSSLIAQFLHGVYFLHRNGIAHLDLKPGNILVGHLDGSLVPHLSIIDFGVSVRVQDDDTTVTGFRGTRYWTAPEVGTEDGPKMTYRAIRADLWSCGRILEHFFSTSALFCDVRKKLLDPDPSRRPLLENALQMVLAEIARNSNKRNIDKKTDMGCVTQKRARNTVLNKEDLEDM